MSKVRVRFAPSPTGFIHVGNARTALINYIFAKKNNGEFILRIEDTDKERNVDDSIEHIISDLYWLKIDWDEGPNKGGKYGPYRQSLRTKYYMEHINKLMDEGKVYPCYCTPEELEQRRQDALAKGVPPRYDNRCRDLSAAEKLSFENRGIKPVYRFKVEPEIIAVNDIIKGEVRFDTSLMGDFVVVRSDYSPTFHLAVCVDDAMMEISHVIRGEDHLSNTPRHVLLFKAFGYNPPEFAHLSLIKGKNNQNLSKRDLNEYFSISGLQKKGYIPESVINYLATLGSAVEESKEIMNMEELIANFELENMGTSIAAFDVDKLDWYGGNYIRSEELSRITELTIPYLKGAGLEISNLDEKEYRYLLDVVDVIRQNVSHLSEMAEYASIFFNKKIELSDEILQSLSSEKSRMVLSAVVDVLTQMEKDITRETFKDFCNKVFTITSIKGRDFYHTLRWALTGKNCGPELIDIFLLLGKDKVKARIKDVL